jgi:hypothetical protein
MKYKFKKSFLIAANFLDDTVTLESANNSRRSMIYMKNTASTILTMALLFSFWGCSFPCSNKVVIDKQFLCDIEKAFQDEIASGNDKSYVYNRIWEHNYYELIYLLNKGDRKAIEVSISLLGQKGYPACLLEGIENIVKPTFESDEDYFWESLEKQEYDVQVRALHLFDFYKPIDWDKESFLVRHPEVKNRYENIYGKN